MQPQDNGLPTNQPMDDQPVNDGIMPLPSSQPMDPNNPLSAGSTIQPQAGGISSDAPAWHNNAVEDANQLYSQPESAVPFSPEQNSNSAQMPPNPLHDETPQPPANPSEAITNDFQNSNIVPQPQEQSPAMPSTPMSEDNNPLNQAPSGLVVPNEPSSAEQDMPQPALAEQSQPIVDQPTLSSSYTDTTSSQQLPGSENLGTAMAQLYQPEQTTGQMQMQQPTGGVMGPPPKKNSKIIFIILGIIIGLAAIGAGVFFLLRNRTSNNTATVTPSTNNTVPQESTPAPSSGPATPPEGYATITKQCYTFALVTPNTVPQDEACTFVDATFGKKQISMISVETYTQEFKTIDEALDLFKPTVTIVSENKTKLDNLDATQIIYKSTDGKTYSRIFTLIVGKKYQQDGKTVTGLSLTTSYQDEYEKQVTPNIIDTWRWQ